LQPVAVGKEERLRILILGEKIARLRRIISIMFEPGDNTPLPFDMVAASATRRSAWANCSLMTSIA
jgi:hypothetical protein